MSRARSVSQLVGANTALGNTVITGTANVSSTLAAGNTTIMGTGYIQVTNATSYTTSTRVGSGLTIYNSSNTNSYAGIELLTEPTTGNAGICGIAGLSTGGGDSALVLGTRGSSTYAERMRIDAAGRVTTPYQPALFAVKNTTVTTTGVVANYDTVYVNVGSHFNNSTGTFTCPIAGKYLVTVSTLLSNGNYHIDDQVQKNGNTLSGYWLRSSINSGTGSNEYETNSATMLFDCAANDTLRYNIATKTGDLYSDGNGWTRFMVYLLG